MMPPLILIVDDEPDNRDLLEILLESEGYRTQTSASGADALLKVAAQLPDVVMLDVMMPGMSGYDVLTALKANDASKHLPVVMVTALDGAARKRALAAGAAAFLNKPLETKDIFECLNALFPHYLTR